MQVTMSEGEKREAYAMLHNLGLGGSCVVGLFKRPPFYDDTHSQPDGRARLGYNFGCECRDVSVHDVDRVKSRTAYSAYAAARM